MPAFLGCDPGAKGAFCILHSSTRTATFFPTPGGKQSLGVVFGNLKGWIGNTPIQAAAIEDVHSLYGMSAKSNFNFGFNVGAAQTILEAVLRQTPLQKIPPKQWQKAVGITAKGKAIKQAVADLAHSLYPEAELYGPKGGLMDGRADALMIAHCLYLESIGE